MKTPSDSKLTKDTPFQGRACSGFLMISVSVLLLAAGIALIILSEVNKAELGNSIYNTLCIFAVLLLIIAPVLLIGLMILEPNQARAMLRQIPRHLHPHRLLLGQSLLLQEESLAPRPQHQCGPHQGQ